MDGVPQLIRIDGRRGFDGLCSGLDSVAILSRLDGLVEVHHPLAVVVLWLLASLVRVDVIEGSQIPMGIQGVKDFTSFGYLLLTKRLYFLSRY